MIFQIVISKFSPQFIITTFHLILNMHTHMKLFLLVFTHVIFIPSNWHFHTNTFWWHSKIFPFLKQQTWMISTLHNFIGPIFPHSWKYFLEISKNSTQKLQCHSLYLFLDFQNRQPLPILKIWRGMGYICNSSCVYSRFPRQYNHFSALEIWGEVYGNVVTHGPHDSCMQVTDSGMSQA